MQKVFIKINNSNVYYLIIIVLLICLIGLGAIYTSSNVVAKYLYNDEFYYLKRQLISLIIGLVSLVFFFKINLKTVIRYSLISELVCLLILSLTLFTPLTSRINGSRSWINLGFISFQPSELFKLTSLIYIASKLAVNYQKIKNLKSLFMTLLLPISGFVIILLQPDLGSALCLIIPLFLAFLTLKIPLKKFIFLAILVLLLGSVFLIIEPYRVQRIKGFINPFSDPLGSGFQIIQSLYAIGGSGFFGRGIDSSIQKHFYLSQPHNDFIFAIILEESGLIGGIFILTLFFLLFHYLMKVVRNSKNPLDFYLSLIISLMICFQLFINLAVVTSLIPVTGVTLPFISYGGSSLIIELAMIGIILNIANREDYFL